MDSIELYLDCILNVQGKDYFYHFRVHRVMNL